MSTSPSAAHPTRITTSLATDFLFWPVWWYGPAFVGLTHWCATVIRGQAAQLGIGIWVKNLFTPMYGQYDWQGRLISFLVRVGMIIGKSIALLIWSMLIWSIVLVWLLAPIGIGYQVIWQLMNLLYA